MCRCARQSHLTTDQVRCTCSRSRRRGLCRGEGASCRRRCGRSKGRGRRRCRVVASGCGRGGERGVGGNGGCGGGGGSGASRGVNNRGVCLAGDIECNCVRGTGGEDLIRRGHDRRTGRPRHTQWTRHWKQGREGRVCGRGANRGGKRGAGGKLRPEHKFLQRTQAIHAVCRCSWRGLRRSRRLRLRLCIRNSYRLRRCISSADARVALGDPWFELQTAYGAMIRARAKLPTMKPPAPMWVPRPAGHVPLREQLARITALTSAAVAFFCAGVFGISVALTPFTLSP